MVYVSEVEGLFPFVDPSNQILDRMYLIQEAVGDVSRQLAAATDDSHLLFVFKDTMLLVRDCALDTSRATDALARFTQAVSSSFTALDVHLDVHLSNIGIRYQAYLDCLEELLTKSIRAVDALLTLDDCVAHTLSYALIIHYIMLHVLIPLNTWLYLIEPSSRAIMLTRGRTTLASIRENVVEIEDSIRLLQSYASDARAHFRPGILSDIRGEPLEKRMELDSALEAVESHLWGSINGMEFVAQRVGWASNASMYLR
ncbi:hypothetical protein BD626DRAFT_472475 [Schizophyllum amplum]|uniref:Uncharacterized protein n=1 Tax=Schizophyllum amplum TaxID=97359 RepID=A0A550CVY5_9AGAR|nr:hypothetical protein BD626DRAFT_472475 [Auriculariopsis ampla]